MAKKDTSESGKVVEYIAEYDRWYTDLLPYFDRFDQNYRQYTTYTDVKGTEARISDPVAPELIEKAVTRFFERDPRFFVVSKGSKAPKKIEKIINGLVDYIWSNDDTVQQTGTMRSKLKKIGREFCVIGNAGVETYYNTISESGDFRQIPIEDIIFNPSKTLKTSGVYYIRQFVDITYLKDNAEVEKDGEVVKGLFKNIKAIESAFDGAQNKAEDVRVERRGNTFASPLVGPIELITRWDGKKCCRFIKNSSGDEGWVVQEYINDVLDDDPLDFVMDIELPKIPYAFSLLDFIAGLTKAKDLLFSQIIDYGAKMLNPPLFADPSIAPINKLTLANAWKVGGLVFANPSQVDHKVIPPMGSTPFEMLSYLQARSEQVTSIGSYLGGVPNQESDKTQGTKGGIQSMLNQAVGSVRDRQQNIEESIIEPVVNKWLKMTGALMGKDELKYVLITGESPEWIKISKGILTGKITVNDLVKSEIIDVIDGEEIKQMIAAKGGDPETFLVFDTDWLIKVESGSMAEADSEGEIQNFKDWVDKTLELGVQIDTKKVSEELARRAKIKEPEQYYIEAGEMAQGQMGMDPNMPQGAMPGMPPQGAMGMPPQQAPAIPQGAGQVPPGILM